jgi:RNA polymerase sigma factor (sigma-70 family)
MNDQEAWIAFQKGDQSSLEKIYRTYYTPLYSYGFKWLRNAQLVEDSIQDLFIKLIRNKEGLTVPDSVQNYLFRSFRTVVLDKLKTQKRNVDIDQTRSSLFVLCMNPESELIKNDEELAMNKRMQQALERLTPRQREVVFLRYLEGFSYQEIGAILNLSPKATYKLMARAIEALRQLMTILVFLMLL